MTATEISTFQAFGPAPFFVFCDHATNAMPADLKCLGLPDDILKTHIAFDIGAGALAERLARKLNGVHFRCEFSRLVIDPNRAITSNDIIAATSDQIPIPGNQMMSEEERTRRVERFHIPYHDRLDAALNQTIASTGAPFVISIHSFTNRLMGAAEDRPWGAGLLWREDEPSARAVMTHLRESAPWPVGDNEPYDARQFNYSVDRHIGPRGLAHITVEVRQDLVSDGAGVETMADLLFGAVSDFA